jgi:VWFA-related protein
MKRWGMGIVCCVALLAAGLCAGVEAQTASTATAAAENAQSPVLELNVRRVLVDVVVEDRQGNPVQGLTAQDFILKEDGVDQHIASFDVTDGSKPSYVPPKLPPLPPDTFVNVPTTAERGPLYIVYYDLVNTPPEDQMAFRQSLMRFLDEAPAGLRIALFIHTQKIYQLQGFTTDHALLRAAIESQGPGPHIPKVFMQGNLYGIGDATGTLDALNFISNYMSGIPGRKNLIWMATYFPIPVGPTVVNPTVGAMNAGGDAQSTDLSSVLADPIKMTYSAMMKSQIALYPLDVSGMGSAEDASGSARAMKKVQMDMIAESTGGQAYTGNNHVDGMMEDAIHHGESYYTLSYASTNAKFDGSERKIQVKLAKEHSDWQLTYRHLYYAVPDGDVALQDKHDLVEARFLAAKAGDTLYANIEHGAPMLHDIVFSAHMSTVGKARMASEDEMLSLQDSPAYFRTHKPGKKLTALPPVKLQKYRIDYGVVDPQLRRMAESGAHPVVEFAAAAYNDEGTLLNSVLNHAEITSADNGKYAALFRAEQELEVPAGAAFLRVAVRDPATNRTGTLEVRLPLAAQMDVASKGN